MRLSTLAAVALILLGLWFRFMAPSPGPGPGPEPEPPPPPVVTKLWVLFLYESEDVDDDRWLANILCSQKIRRLASDKLVLKFADDDELDEKDNTPASTKPWIEHAEKENWALPHIIMADQDGNLVYHGVVPRTVDETVDLVRRFSP